ncbi:hypothetical protein N7532_000759 [Penicillium argentinense]|uniref:N-acetyltransferase domain-containing protein n=1 Tax=Penicillium argentinense TaxID=1131581 RepID=A0A9W9G676_9EURO|nr:uncharacterized protein N7532_000759 [Penicillium argentinense]KAJ5112714.1 hypothetical protein N7532_000759 [Penicillium argentinense]
MTESQFKVKVIPTKEEYARLVDVLWSANFNPYNPICTTVHLITGHTPSDRARDKALDTKIWWNASANNPYSHLIYVLDKETSHVAGGCECFIFCENPFPNGPQPIKCTWYPDGSKRKEYAECMLSQASFLRQSWFQRPHAGVNAMGVHPELRRRGFGRLLEGGHARIDPLGYESFIERSPADGGFMRSMGIGELWGSAWDFVALEAA